MSLQTTVLAKGERIKAARNAIRDELATAGIPIDAETPFEDYAGKVRELAQQAEPSADEAIVSVTINPTGGTYELPTDADVLAQLLEGARIAVTVEGLTHPILCAVDSLLDATYAVRVPLNTTQRATVRLLLGTAPLKYASDTVAVTVRPGAVADATVTTYRDMTETVEIGRVQRYSDASGASFLIKRVHSGGETHTHFGAWLPDGTWLDQSGLKSVVYDCPDADSNPVERIISTSGGDAVDITQTLACLRDMKQVVVTLHTDTPIDNYFMRYPQLYVKKERTTISVPTLAEDGTVASTTETDVVILWYADTQVDENYHLHSLFVQYQRAEGSETPEAVECPYGYIARYPIKFVSGKKDGATLQVATSAPDGSSQVAGTRAAFLGACVNNNRVATTIDGVYYAADDERRWSMVSHMAEVSFLQHICYLMFGVDVQAAISGICSGSAAATANGGTDWLFAKGIMFGASDTKSSSASCLIAGIEDGLHSSTGWMTADLTFFFERYADNTTEPYMIHARDRLDFNPASGDVDTLLTAGYRKLSFPVGSTKRIGADDAIGARDLMIMAQSVAQDQDHITIAGVDNFWAGSAPASGTAGRNAFMVALGHHRSSGSYLGAFFVTASNALSYSLGGYWRSRASLQVVAR